MNVIHERFREIATLVAEPVRATLLWTLLDGRAYTATELAIATDCTPSNTSMHLAKLLAAGLLSVKSQGRHRYYCFSGPEVAYAIEGLAALIPYGSAKSISPEEEVAPVKQLRSCYDHLAGRTAVAVTDALLRKKIIIAQNDNSFELSTKGRKWFIEMGINSDELEKQRRLFLRPCLDWSERRPHMAGSLAAALLDKMINEDWVRRIKNSRALIVTAKGRKMFYEMLRVIV